MFHIRDEGEKLAWGFNFYPLASTSSWGFKFKLAEGKGFAIRYSKTTKRWHGWTLWRSKRQQAEDRARLKGK